jgi:sRNA-binding regulator protein Hfq
MILLINGLKDAGGIKSFSNPAIMVQTKRDAAD